MDITIALPWWLLAGLVIASGVLLYRALRGGHPGLIRTLETNRRRLEQYQALAQGNRQKHLLHYFTHLASLRLHLSLLGFERQFRQQQQVIARLHADMRNLVEQVLEELRRTELELPDAPEWTAAVDAVASLPVDRQNEAIRDILSQIQETAMSQQREALREYRWVMGVRNRTLGATSRYWKKLLKRCASLESALRRLDRQQAVISAGIERYDAHRDSVSSRKTSLVFIHFGLSAAMLGLGGWLAVAGGGLLLQALIGAGLAAQSAWLVLTVYAVLLFVLGAIFCTAMRWTALVLPLAELDDRPRHYVLIISGFALIMASVAGASPVASTLRLELMQAGWSMTSGYLLSTQLWLLPVVLAFQVLVIERLVRVSQPLFWLSFERSLAAMAVTLRVLHQLPTKPSASDRVRDAEEKEKTPKHRESEVSRD